MTDSDKFTIKIPREDGERHNERRQEMNLTWLEYIDGEAPSMPTNGEVDTEALVNGIRDQLDVLAFDGALTEQDLERIESSLSAIESRTGRVESMVEQLGGQR